jgi:prepilin-type N-terminal cleavage/methylation domain-containing protein
MNSLKRMGFTLIEVMISLTMLGVIMGAVVGTMTSMQRGYIRQREVARTEDALRVAELTITRILQAGASNPLNMAVGPAQGPRIDPLVAPFEAVRVYADYNPIDGDLLDVLEDVEVSTAFDTLFVRWQAGALPTAVAFPVRSLLFQYDSAGTVRTVPAEITRAATRVRVTIMAPRHSRTTVLARRDTWVYLRNRR